MKRLYIFVLKTFLPLLLATFSICLFILLMQFLWRYVNDMVGKGVSIGVLGEMFFYASLSSIPLALPLSILLASLMTFGSLAEHLELLAIKASGTSLIRIMKPLIYSAVAIAFISFVFQNNIVPKAQMKMYTILVSLRQKSPELDIPEGSFYKEITGYNVYVRHKDKKGGMLRNMMIYDYSKGFENAAVIVADSGQLNVSADKKYLVLTLYSGESFENLGTRRTRNVNEKIPYRRETFVLRDILISFDTNFNMADESIMGGRDISKSIKELTTFIDSTAQRRDSTNRETAVRFKQNVYENTFKGTKDFSSGRKPVSDSLFRQGFKIYFNRLNVDNKIRYLQQAKSKVDQVQSDYNIVMHWQSEEQRQLRSHSVQLYNRFSLALSCILFFFIGAPLGAIIRKGGLGLPTVISVLLFILYYVTDNFGSKMAKQGVWPIGEGVWLSSVVLASLGAFLTYKAANDSTILDLEAWNMFFQRIIGKRELRNYSRKEVIMTPPDYQADQEKMLQWNEQAKEYLKNHKKPIFYLSFWKKGFTDTELNHLVETQESIIDDLLNSEEVLVIGKLMDYPVIRPLQWKFSDRKFIRWFCGIVFPIGIIIYVIAILKQKQLNNDLIVSCKVNERLIEEFANQLYE
ncbi:MAG: LptF/LptG family permease [Candidatus Azobacteroides sp.]|nr:LptF/LptG family permease [Candidatus Azobacteroides sp.]